jgi:membrane peptidoglycan carboxypeptidase
LITQGEFEAERNAFLLRNEISGRFSMHQLTAAGTRPCYQHALERVLVGMLGDQTLYRRGMTIRTTLDKNLQNELLSLERKAEDGQGALNDEIMIISQNGQVRAFICAADREAEVQEKLAPPVFFAASDYEVSTAPVKSIARDRIILSVEGDNPKSM